MTSESIGQAQYDEDRGIHVEETALERLIHVAVHDARRKGSEYVEYIRLDRGRWYRSPTHGNDSFYYRVTSSGAVYCSRFVKLTFPSGGSDL